MSAPTTATAGYLATPIRRGLETAWMRRVPGLGWASVSRGAQPLAECGVVAVDDRGQPWLVGWAAAPGVSARPVLPFGEVVRDGR